MSDARSSGPEDTSDFAPKLAYLSADLLYGDIWERPGLSKRDRSLITVAALLALYRPEQLARHMKRAVDNGVTVNELIEAITHLAFYAGWPNATDAMAAAKRLFGQGPPSGTADEPPTATL